MEGVEAGRAIHHLMTAEQGLEDTQQTERYPHAALFAGVSPSSFPVWTSPPVPSRGQDPIAKLWSADSNQAITEVVKALLDKGVKVITIEVAK